jgi:signal transduction histidine kinase/DNA-binding response OmpR family regulator
LTDGELFDDSISRQIDLQGGLESWVDGNYEARALRRSGERFPAELSVTRIDEDGRFVVMLRDITDRKRAERELRLARDKAVEANEAKSRFLANISHELRTPLNAVIGYSELVHEDLEGTDQADVLPDIDRITKAGHHLLSLINDILDLSKAEADKMDLYVEEVELDELLEEITDTVRPVVEEKQNTLKIDVDQAPETLRTDRQKLRQMLLNLLSNAAKFTEENLVRLHAFAEQQQGREVCVFEVIDRGIGIPEEKLDELFEAFTQADESTTREYGGTGLGLTITKRFTDMMGGEIDVESQVGEGSTFRITLPVDVEHPDGGRGPTAGEERVEAAETETEAEEARQGEPEATRRGPLVLVIDDDPSVHRLMEQHLGREGFAVETARGADQGIEKARRLEPDVITLDVLMPDVDGWQTLDRLQSDPELTDIPVVMVTIVSDQNMGFSLGASDYLTKPVDREVLAGTLAEHAGKPNGRPIVIAEDDEETRQLLERTVERAGWSTVTAPDGQKALEALDNGIDPSALLLDLMMPNLDGFELLDELRERPDFRHVPVIVVTAAELSAEERKSLESKVDQIFRKGDFAHDQLIDELETALETPKPADRN